MAAKTLRVSARVERHDPGLPRYVVVPSSGVHPWRLEGTTVVEGTLDGTALGRRTLKRWDEDRWFLDLPERLCRRAGVETGDEVDLEIRRASTELPPELAELQGSSSRARETWRELSASRQRVIRCQAAALTSAPGGVLTRLTGTDPTRCPEWGNAAWLAAAEIAATRRGPPGLRRAA